MVEVHLIDFSCITHEYLHMKLLEVDRAPLNHVLDDIDVALALVLWSISSFPRAHHLVTRIK